MRDEKIQLRILILCPLPYISAIPFVIESCIGFADRGYKVDVLVSDACDPPFECDHENVCVYTFRHAIGRRGIQHIGFFKAARLQAGKERYDLTIGLAQMGLIAAARLKKRLGIPCIFFNDEIRFGNERHSLVGNAFGYATKLLERRANRQVLFTVTQDPERGRFLAQANRIPMDSMRYLPNSRAGRAEIATSTYMHDRFGFSHDTKIVLWLGVARPTEGGLELAREAASWPEPFRLVFHFRTEHPTPYIREIIKCHGNGKTYVSSKPIPYNEVGELAGSASIGLGIYEDQGPNTRYIGASSGKINAFLKAGVPCITSDYEGFKWIEEGGAGVCVSDVSTVFETVKKIASDLPAYQRRAVALFEERLSFDKGFEPIADELAERLGT